MTTRKNKRIDSSGQPKILFWSLGIFIFLGLLSYGYLVKTSIVNIVARQGVEKDISILSSKVVNLESDYVKLKNLITIESAEELGFVGVSSQRFVTKTVGDNLGLSVNLR